MGAESPASTGQLIKRYSAYFSRPVAEKAGEDVLNDPSEDIGTIGINIVKLILSPDREKMR